MIQVACISCGANYDVDERRIPASGMRMRCPKCSTGFMIDPDGSTRAAPAGPPPPPPPPGAKPRIAPPPMLGGVDLPAPKGAGGFGELDLPAPKGAAGFGELDLPAPKGAGGFGELDLPAPKGAGGFGELDLPAPKGAGVDLPAPKRGPAPGSAPLKDSADFSDLDLPAPKRGGVTDLPALKDSADFSDLDLPAPKASGGFGDLDLPMAKVGAVDLPMPKMGGVDLPAPKGASGFGDLDLPIPKGFGHADLPAPKAGFELDLPAVRGPAPEFDTGRSAATGGDFVIDMPGASASPGLDDLDIPTPKIDLDDSAQNVKARGAGRLGLAKTAPTPPKDPFGELDLGGERKPGARDSFGELDLGEAKPASAGGFGELDLGGGGDGGGSDLSLPQPRARGDVSKDGRVGAGSTGFGELDLGGGGGGGGSGDLDDALEFGGLGAGSDLPGLDDVAPIVRESMVSSQVSIEEKKAALAERRRRRGRNLMIGTAVFLVVGGAAGFALQFTPYGPFGQYAIEQLLPAGGSPESARAAIDRAEREIAADTFEGYRRGLSLLGGARHEEGLNRPLLARSLMHEALYLTRFGADASSSARMNTLATRLHERSDQAPFIELAQAAVALSANDPTTAASKATAARRLYPNDAYVDILLGEAALAGERPADAATAFRSAMGKRGGARAAWGLARALIAQSDPGAAAAIDAVLALSPRHAEARIQKARDAVRAGDLPEASRFAREAAGMERVDNTFLRISPRTRAAALTVVGRVEELRANRIPAKEAYDAASEIDGFNLDALVGSGRVLLEGLQPNEALVRFQSAIETGSTAVSIFDVSEHPRPLVVEARFGAIAALIALERPQDALAHIEALGQLISGDATVDLARGRVLQALGRPAEAEAAFRKAIELAPTSFEAYLSLAKFLFDSDRSQDAITVLQSAEGHVTITAEVRRLEGELELQRNQLASAREKFLAALALDPNDFASRFMLGVAYRRDGMYADAARELDLVLATDPGYPGLALERGLIFESMGRSEEAVRMYMRALQDRPDDVDLRIRLGGAQVVAGMLNDAQATLDGVLESQPNNATAIHYLGRLALARNELDLAVEKLQAAVRLEPARAEFHAWLAAAMIEKNNLAGALTEIRATLERDSSSVDGHILNARVLARSGHLDDALAEVQHALTVDPRRLDAWAVVGECEEQRGRQPQAIAAYRAAIAWDPSRGDWWNRMARIQVYVGDIAGGIASYRRAAELGDRRDPRPTWSYESWRALGNVAADRGDRATAAEAYRKYLETAPSGAAARTEVQLALSRL